jgi:hypothetical protein
LVSQTLLVAPYPRAEIGLLIPIQELYRKIIDIERSKSISDIDQQLYIKYQLSKEETAFIEENVQAMV